MKRAILPIQTKVRPVGFPPVAETLPGAIERIVSKLKPEKIILFGSYAYGNPTPDSDVDLLVIMKTRAREIDRYIAVSNLLYPRQFPVDILAKDSEGSGSGIPEKGELLYEGNIVQGEGHF